MKAQDKLIELRAERCQRHDRMDALALQMQTNEINFRQAQQAAEAELNAEANRIAEIKRECAVLESLGVPQDAQAVPV